MTSSYAITLTRKGKDPIEKKPDLTVDDDEKLTHKQVIERNEQKISGIIKALSHSGKITLVQVKNASTDADVGFDSAADLVKRGAEYKLLLRVVEEEDEDEDYYVWGNQQRVTAAAAAAAAAEAEAGAGAGQAASSLPNVRVTKGPNTASSGGSVHDSSSIKVTTIGSQRTQGASVGIADVVHNHFYGSASNQKHEQKPNTSAPVEQSDGSSTEDDRGPFVDAVCEVGQANWREVAINAGSSWTECNNRAQSKHYQGGKEHLRDVVEELILDIGYEKARPKLVKACKVAKIGGALEDALKKRGLKP